jgi:hypothetical protein
MGEMRMSEEEADEVERRDGERKEDKRKECGCSVHGEVTRWINLEAGRGSR